MIRNQQQRNKDTKKYILSQDRNISLSTTFILQTLYLHVNLSRNMRNKWTTRYPLRYKVYLDLDSSSDDDSDSPHVKENSSAGSVATRLEQGTSPHIPLTVAQENTKSSLKALPELSPPQTRQSSEPVSVKLAASEAVQDEFKAAAVLCVDEVQQSKTTHQPREQSAETIRLKHPVNNSSSQEEKFTKRQIKLVPYELTSDESDESETDIPPKSKSTKCPPDIKVFSNDSKDTLNCKRSPYNLRQNRKRAATAPLIKIDSLDSEDDIQQNSRASSPSFSHDLDSTRMNVTSYSPAKLRELIASKVHKLKDTCWLIDTSRFSPRYGLLYSAIKGFFTKFGSRLEHLHWSIEESTGTAHDQKKITSALMYMLSRTRNLKKIHLWYDKAEYVPRFFDSLAKLYKSRKLQDLTSLHLRCTSPVHGIGKSEMKALLQSRIPFKVLDIGEFQYDRKVVKLLDKFLNTHRNTLVSLTIGCGFIGDDVPAMKVRLPGMPNLKTLHLSNQEDFNDVDSCEELENNTIELTFDGPLPSLTTFTSGLLVTIKNLRVPVVAKLETFRCQYDWHRSLFNGKPASDFHVQQSNLINLQLPTKLDDVLFVSKVPELFGNLKSLWIDLPSQSVLHSIFTHFADPKVVRLEELKLQFRFDFPLMLESCLFPDVFKGKQRSPSTQQQLDILRKYKWSVKYCEEFSLELPLEETNPVDRSAKGLKGLKSLKLLHLNYLGRQPLHLPRANEDRRWNDPHCQLLQDDSICFSSNTGYLMSLEFHYEIEKLKLENPNFKCIGENCSVPKHCGTGHSTKKIRKGERQSL